MNIQEQTLEHLIQCPLMVTEISKVEDNCAHNLTACMAIFEDKLRQTGGYPDNKGLQVLELWGAVSNT